ncbi:Hypothetical protein SMAX5B_007824, partial [Scophthalmus maximus]
GILCLFFPSPALILSRAIGFSRGVGEVEKVTVEISAACIALASPPLQIGFLLPSSHTDA